MKCFSLLLGARNTPAAAARFAPADEELVRSITFRHFPDGFTMLRAEGGWFDPAQGAFVEEESRQVIVCAPSRRPLRPWLEELAVAMKQDELIVVDHGQSVKFRAKLRQAAGSGRRRRA
ncbi:MAG TPA: DUF3574 domain-containing protein [Opitutus sp.]|nr:DUF3574 domain-containing protein [Opitutus sp.]